MTLEEFGDAVEYGNIEAVRSVLNADPSMANVTFDNRNCPLHKAANQGHVQIAKLLIERGGKVSAIGSDERTPLHYAIDANNAEMVELLIANGADLTIRDERGLSPLACAARQYVGDGLDSEEEIFNRIRDAGAPYDLTAAAYMSDIERVREIIHDDPVAPSLIPSPGHILAGLVFNDWRDAQTQIAILDLLFRHGFRPLRKDVEDVIQACDMHGGKVSIAKCLQSYAQQLE